MQCFENMLSFRKFRTIRRKKNCFELDIKKYTLSSYSFSYVSPKITYTQIFTIEGSQTGPSKATLNIKNFQSSSKDFNLSERTLRLSTGLPAALPVVFHNNETFQGYYDNFPPEHEIVTLLSYS